MHSPKNKGARRMNHIYRLIWNRAAGAWVVASEITRSHGKNGAGTVTKGVLSTASVVFVLGAGQAWAQTVPSGTIDVGAGTTQTEPSVISGADALTKTGAGMLILSGANDYSGGTELDAGVLSVSSNVNLGDATGGLTFNGGTLQTTATMSMSRVTIVNAGGGTFDVGTGTILTQSGAISGTGALTKRGAGTLILTGANSELTGSGVSVTGGSLVLDGGSLDLNFNNAKLIVSATGGDTADLRLQNGNRVTVSASGLAEATIGNSGGSGSLTITGSGSELFAINTSIGDAGTGALNVTDGGALSGSVVNIGVSAGSATATVSGAGSTLTASGGMDHGGGAGLAIAISDATGTLTIADAAVVTAGNTYLAVQGGHGTLNLNGRSGSRGVLLTDSIEAGYLGTFTGGSTASLVFDGGILRANADTAGTSTGDFLKNFTTGKGTITINNGGAFLDTNGHAVSTAAVFGGSGGFTKQGTGALTLSGANTYTGGTTVEGGTLTAGAAGAFVGNTAYTVNSGTLDLNSFDLSMSSLSGSGGTVALGTAALTVDQAINTSFAGVISGTGNFTKTGAGSLMLAGDSSAYTGTTNIVDGLLSVNGKLGGDLNITGGKLGGSGSIGNLSVSGGIVAPGNSIGTLHVGNVSLDPGSVYQVEVNAAGQSDQIAASGTATINDSSVQVLAGAGDYALQTQYTILTASGGRSGQFSGVTSNFAFLDPFLSYDANNAYLTLLRNDATLVSVGRTTNQIATGGGVNSLGAGNAVHDAVLRLSPDQARNAFDQLSGEIRASAQTAMMEESRFVRDAANDRLRSALGAPGASRVTVAAYGANGLPGQVAPTHSEPVFWSTVYGSWGKTDSDGNAAGLDRSSNGLLMGVDRNVGNWRLGVLTGYGQTKFDTPSPSASGTSKNYHLGAYGGTAWGNVSLRTGMAYTWHDINTKRSVAIPGLVNSLKDDYHGGSFQAFGELAYGADINGMRVEPFANVAHVRLRTDGSGEQGGVTALQTDKSTNNVTFSTLGLRGEHTFDLRSTKATLIGSVGWRHAMGDITPTATQRFATGNAFTVSGVPIARNSAVIETGLDVAVSDNATLNVSYMGQLASGARDHGVRGNLSVRF
jgi:outer membrane autotransporter protein